MRAPTRPAALLASALLCVAAPLAVAAPASADPSPAPSQCGGTLSDYVGVDAPDTAFTGYVDDYGVRTPLTVTPLDVDGAVRAEIQPPDADPDSVTAVVSTAAVEKAWNGSPMFVFNTPRGAAESDSLECATPAPGSATRVTRITGTVLVGPDHLESFVLARP
ncbi:hypothetical protein GCM10009839_45850 [Catenulispora yoronensis]|uniref:Uncharacterized protein n=1 Tax=Catenulispora yoronensis TaxID=450799 RepID=A0ABP5G328_9ACTN